MRTRLMILAVGASLGLALKAAFPPSEVSFPPRNDDFNVRRRTVPLQVEPAQPAIEPQEDDEKLDRFTSVPVPQCPSQSVAFV